MSERRKEGVSAGTINHGLKVVRRILNLAATEWMDDHGLTWLVAAPKIKLLPDTAKRQPYPLNWDEQSRLFKELPEHLATMALFAVNTGCRDGEVCGLQWSWEVKVPELKTTVFMVPGELVKNGDERLVVLNRVAQSVVEAQRGKHSTHVFTHRGKPVQRMLNGAWLRARQASGTAAGSGPRFEAHVWAATAGRRRELRGSTGFAGASVGPDDHSLLGSGALEADRGREPGV